MTGVPPASPDSGAGVRAFFAWLLIVAGGLIALLCGGCTGFFLVLSVMDALRMGASSEAQGYDVVGIVSALLIGGLPTGVGVGALIVGLRLRRPPAAPPQP